MQRFTRPVFPQQCQNAVEIMSGDAKESFESGSHKKLGRKASSSRNMMSSG